MFNIPSKIERGIHNWSDHTGILMFVYSLSWTHPQGQLAQSSNSNSCYCSCLLFHELVIGWTKSSILQPRQIFEKIFFPLIYSWNNFCTLQKIFGISALSILFCFLTEASLLMRLQRIWLINRKEAFNWLLNLKTTHSQHWAELKSGYQKAILILQELCKGREQGN